jgi:uncharacterized protein YjbJ (UPF0337 family)
MPPVLGSVWQYQNRLLTCDPSHWCPMAPIPLTHGVQWSTTKIGQTVVETPTYLALANKLRINDLVEARFSISQNGVQFQAASREKSAMRFPTGFVFEPYAHYRMAPLTSIQYGQLAEVFFIMNWDQASGKWNQIKGSVKEKWGKLTDDDMQVIEGNRDRLVGKIQERYGVTKENAEEQVARWTLPSIEEMPKRKVG